MDKQIGQSKRTSFVHRRRKGRPPFIVASSALLLAFAGACGGDDSRSGVTTQTESQSPAANPGNMPSTMEPANPEAGDSPGVIEPSASAPGGNEGPASEMLPLEPGGMEGEAGGEAMAMPPAEEMPPAEAPPPEPAAFNPCPTDGSACRIMPLGDSITDGLVGNAPGNTTQSVGGYRVELFRRAAADGHAVTFVGRQQNGPDQVDGQAFPRSHEGYSGATISSGQNQIASRLDAALEANPPDIILLHIGTNDMIQAAAAAPGNLENLIDQIVEGAPDALVVVAQIIPLGFGDAVQTYNAAIPAIVQERIDAGRHLLLVDHFTPIASTPNFVAELVGDNVHPNAAGYAIMAATWYEAIEGFLP